MNNTQYMVYWTRANGDACNQQHTVMVDALATCQTLRKDPANRFVTMASENVENVGLVGVSAVVDGKCPDGGDFLGRISRHSLALKRGR